MEKTDFIRKIEEVCNLNGFKLMEGGFDPFFIDEEELEDNEGCQEWYGHFEDEKQNDLLGMFCLMGTDDNNLGINLEWLVVCFDDFHGYSIGEFETYLKTVKIL